MDSERLLIERAKQRLSRQELAERSGVNAHTISEMERGVRNPRATTVAKIAEALGLEPEDLLGKAPAPSTSGLRSRGRDRDSIDEPVRLPVLLERMQSAGVVARGVAHDWRRESARSLEEGRPLSNYRILEMYSFHNVLIRLYLAGLEPLLESARLGTVGITEGGVNQYLSAHPALWPRELKEPLREAGAYVAALPQLINEIETEATEQRRGAAEQAIFEEFNVESHREELNKALAEVGH